MQLSETCITIFLQDKCFEEYIELSEKLLNGNKGKTDEKGTSR